MEISATTLKVGYKILSSTWQIYAAWEKKADESQREELERLIAEIQQTKPLGQRIGESLSRSLQSLRLSDGTLDALRKLDADPLFHDNVALCLAKGTLSIQQLSELIQESSPELCSSIQEILAVSALWLDAIHMIAGESPSISHALQIKSNYRIEASIVKLEKDSETIINEAHKNRQLLEGTQSIGLQSLSQIEKVKELLQGLVDREQSDFQTSAVQSFLEKQFQSRFERCRADLIAGSIELAELNFLELIKELNEAGHLGSKKLLFRSYLNLSSCHLFQDRIAEAKAALAQAKALFPYDNRYHRHHATFLSYTGQNGEALEIIRKLRQEEPDEVKNIADEIAILCDLGRDDELATLVDSVDIQDVDIQCHKAHALLRLSRNAEAIVAAKCAVTLKPDAEGPWIALAYAQGFSVVNKRESGSPTRLCPAEDDVDQLNEAITASLNADLILEKRARHSIRDEVQANLLAFYNFSGRQREALALARRMKISPNSADVTLVNLYHVFRQNGCDEEAFETADALVKKHGTEKARLRKVDALIQLGKSKLALEELDNLRLENPLCAKSPAWISCASQAYFHLHNADEAINLLNNGIKDHHDSVELHIVMANLLREIGRTDEAYHFYQLSESLAPDHPEVLVNFGQFLYFEQDWNGALLRLEKIGAQSWLNPLFPRYVASLFNAGKVDECIECVRRWKTHRSEVDENVFGAGARAAIRSEDWPLAKTLLEDLIRNTDSDGVSYRKLLAQVFLRMDDLPEAYTLLTQVVADRHSDVEALTLLAQTCSASGKHHEALLHHAEAMRFDTVDIHARAAFFAAMVALPEGFEPTPKQIELHHENIGILTAHPSGILRAINMGREDDDIDISEIRKELEKNEKAVTEALEYADSNPMPLQILASNLASPLFDAWLAFTKDSKRGVNMCGGTAEQQETQLIISAQRKAVSVDLIALFTLQRLGQLQILTSLFDKIYVHISVLDSVVRELRSERDLRSTYRISSNQGQLLIDPIQPQVKEEKIRSLTEIRDFLKEEPVILAGLRSDTKFETLVPHLGVNVRFEELMKPALVAYEQGAVLLSDDCVFRQLSTPLQCPAFCTQALLKRAVSEKVISVIAYQDAVIELHSMNYRYVSDNLGTLSRLMDKSPTLTDPIALNIVAKLVSSSMSSQNSKRVLEDLLIWIWAKGCDDISLSEKWMSGVCFAIEKMDPKMNLLLELISGISWRNAKISEVFFTLISFIYQSHAKSIFRTKTILNHALVVARAAADKSLVGGNKRLHAKWNIQADRLQIFMMLEMKSLRLRNRR